MLQIGLILLFFDDNYFTMVEENFEIRHSEMLQIGLILLLFDDNYFTMVEENFEIWHSEMLQIGLILLLFEKVRKLNFEFGAQRETAYPQKQHPLRDLLSIVDPLRDLKHC